MMQNLEVTTTNQYNYYTANTLGPSFPSHSPLGCLSAAIYGIVLIFMYRILCTIGGGFANYGDSRDEEVRTF